MVTTAPDSPGAASRRKDFPVTAMLAPSAPIGFAGSILRLAGTASSRTLHIVDIENLMGDPRAGTTAVAEAFGAYLTRAGYRPGDLVLVAANPELAFDIAAGAPVPHRLWTRPGTDGADSILVERVSKEFAAARFDRVAIGSGDHAFAPLAAAVHASETPVVVVSRPGSLSGALQGCGYGIRFLPEFDEAAAVAA